MKSCKVEGCHRLLAPRSGARGMCQTHYNRWLRGDPIEAPIPFRRPLERTETHKQCGQCLELLPVETFARRGTAYTYNCKPCARWHSILKRYGVDRATWLAMYDAQQGRCAICEDPIANTPGKHVGTDHCHATGRVRGILCVRCNSALSGVERAGLGAFANYLTRG